MVRVIISDEHDINRVEAWCERCNIKAVFRPHQSGGHEATVTENDGFTMRLALGYGPTLL
jgi:hypothetical protein